MDNEQEILEPTWLTNIANRTKTLVTGQPKRPRSVIMSYDDYTSVISILVLLGTTIYNEFALAVDCQDCPQCQPHVRLLVHSDEESDLLSCEQHRDMWSAIMNLKKLAFSVWMEGPKDVAES